MDELRKINSNEWEKGEAFSLLQKKGPYLRVGNVVEYVEYDFNKRTLDSFIQTLGQFYKSVRSPEICATHKFTITEILKINETTDYLEDN